MKDYLQHPLSVAFPPMDVGVFRELIDDIDQNGVRERIVLFEGKILDGWHRYQACQELRVLKPPMQEYEGDDPIGYVLSKNLHRRHLPAGERAMIMVRLTTWQEGSGRISKSLARAGGNFTTLDQAAGLAGVSKSTMQHARKATLTIDAVQQAVSEGKISISNAAKLAGKPVKEQEAAVSKVQVKPEVRPKVQSVPLAVFENLQKQYETLEDQYDSLASELEFAQKELSAVDAIRNSHGAKELMSLYQQLRSMTEARDEWQNKCNELTKQLNYLTKKK